MSHQLILPSRAVSPWRERRRCGSPVNVWWILLLDCRFHTMQLRSHGRSCTNVTRLAFSSVAHLSTSPCTCACVHVLEELWMHNSLLQTPQWLKGGIAGSSSNPAASQRPADPLYLFGDWPGGVGEQGEKGPAWKFPRGFFLQHWERSQHYGKSREANFRMHARRF